VELPLSRHLRALWDTENSWFLMRWLLCARTVYVVLPANLEYGLTKPARSSTLPVAREGQDNCVGSCKTGLCSGTHKSKET